MGLPGWAPEKSGENIVWRSKLAVKQRTDNVIFVGFLRTSHGRSRCLGS